MRILLITGRRLSEVVLSTALLDRVLRSYEGACVDIICPKGTEEVFAALPQLGRVLQISESKDWRKRLQNIRKLRRTHYDLVLDLGRRWPSRLLRYKKLLCYDGSENACLAEDYAALWPSSRPVRPLLWLSPRVLEGGKLKLQGMGRPLIAICASSSQSYKRWPLTRWRELFSRVLGTKGFESTTFVVFGASIEASQVEVLAREFPAGRVLNLVGVTTVGEVAGALKECDLFIGLEGGIMHLAAAQGVPTVGLFGPSSEKRWGPLGERVCTVVPPQRSWKVLNLPKDMPPRVMTDISVQDVLCKLPQLWEDKRPKKG